MSPEEVAAEIKGLARELNEMIETAKEEHNVTTQVLSDKGGIEVRCYLRKAL